jgi:exoribonuclease II
MQMLGTSIYEANMVERQTNRYWTLEYLNRSVDRDWEALVLRWLREDERLALILIEDLGVELAMRFNRWVDIGERIQVQVALVDPRRDIIHLQEISKSRHTCDGVEVHFTAIDSQIPILPNNSRVQIPSKSG